MNHILIIDAGATHSRCAVVKDTELVSKMNTIGFSPIVNSAHDFPTFNLGSMKMDKIFYFGTAINPENSNLITELLKKQFPQSTIQVKSDLWAAALATCGNEAGNVHIMGTGSAVNFWDGDKLTNPKYNLGYIWEDYASGYDISKTIIQYWNEGKLSNAEIERLESEWGSIRTFVQKVYQSNPKPFLAQASFQLHLLSPENQKKIINERLELYFTKNIDIFANRNKHHFVGSMAKLFETHIETLLEKRKLQLGSIIENTLDGLISYYIKSQDHE